MKYLKDIFIGLIIAFIIFTAIEILLRVYDYGIKYKKLELDVSLNNIGIPLEDIHIYLFKKGFIVCDQRLIWRYKASRSGKYQFCSLGFRMGNKGEPERAKANDLYRIIVLGGSHPFALGLNYEDAYASQLEYLFKSEKNVWKKRVEVINAAVPGYSTTQVLNLLKYYMVGYKPDLVIIDTGNNDRIPLTSKWPWGDSELIKIMHNCPYNIMSLLQRSSSFWYYREFLYWLRDLICGEKYVTKNICSRRVSLEENSANLKEMKKIAEKNSFKIIFLSQMCFDNGKLAKGYGSIEEPYVDIYSKLKDRQDISSYFIDNIHGSALGHREIAKLIYEYLKSGFLGEEIKK